MLPFDHKAALTQDLGGIVLGWLTKVVVAIALVGVVAFDALSIGVTKVSLTDQGEAAAREASEVWKTTNDIQQAYDTAVSTAREANEGNSIDAASFTVDPGGTVHLRITREATSLVLHRVGPLEDWVTVSQEAEGRVAL